MSFTLDVDSGFLYPIAMGGTHGGGVSHEVGRGVHSERKPDYGITIGSEFEPGGGGPP